MSHQLTTVRHGGRSNSKLRTQISERAPRASIVYIHLVI